MERKKLAKVSVCVCPCQCVHRRKVSMGSFYVHWEAIRKTPRWQPHQAGSQESCPCCGNKICSNIERERIQEAVLNRLFLAGPDSMAGPLESGPVCLYVGRNCQNQVQVLSKISQLPAAGRVLMLLGPKTGGSANGITPTISRSVDAYN